MRPPVILLPGGVLPKELAYGALLEAIGDRADAHAKDLEVYAGDEPPAGYGLELEIEAVLSEADAAGFASFHLVGYSAGGAVATTCAAAHPARVLSIALLEPAWVGNRGLAPEERAVWAELERIAELPPGEMMHAFVRAQLAPGVDPPPPPPGPQPAWMAKRPAGLAALLRAFADHDLDPEALRGFPGPVLYALGSLSNPDLYSRAAERVGRLFPDFTLEVFEGRHHFDPPHRVEPERLAESLLRLWRQAA